MKQYKGFLLGVLVTVLASTLFWAGTVYATTGCFPDTNGHWAETFICWMKDTGISSGYPDGTYKPANNVTRAEMAVMLQKAVELPPSIGEIRINTGAGNWKQTGTASGTLTLYSWDEYAGYTSSANNQSFNFL